MNPSRFPPRPVWVRALNVLVDRAPLSIRHGHNSLLMHRALRPDEPAVDLPRNLRFCLAGEAEHARIRAHPEALAAPVYQRRLQHGDRCYCLLEECEPLAWNWVRVQRGCVMCGFEQQIDMLPLGPGQAFSYDFYTCTSQRNRGIGTLLKRAVLAELARQGAGELFALVMPRSGASLHVHLALGYTVRCMVYGYRLRGWQRTWFSGVAEAAALERWLRDVVAEGQAG